MLLLHFKSYLTLIQHFQTVLRKYLDVVNKQLWWLKPVQSNYFPNKFTKTLHINLPFTKVIRNISLQALITISKALFARKFARFLSFKRIRHFTRPGYTGFRPSDWMIIYSTKRKNYQQMMAGKSYWLSDNLSLLLELV